MSDPTPTPGQAASGGRLPAGGKSAPIPLARVPRVLTFWRRYVLPALLLVYLIGIFYASLRLVLFAWPGSPYADFFFGGQRERQAAEEVTRQHLEALGAAQKALLAGKSAPDQSMTAADRARVEAVRQYVGLLISTNAWADKVLGDPRQVVARNWTEAIGALSTAERMLGQRFENRTDANPKFRWHYMFGWCLRTRPPLSLAPPLLPVERAEAVAREGALAPTLTVHFLGSSDLEMFVVLGGLGALGAAVQGIMSLAMYLGTRRFVASWAAFYFIRPFVGSGMALAFFIVTKGGLLTEAAGGKAVNLFGNAAIAIVVGLFAGEAMERLREIAGAFFKKNESADTIDAKPPRIQSAKPLTIARKKGIDLELHGERFRASSAVFVNGALVSKVRYESEKLLVAEIRPFPALASLTIQVITPDPEGGRSAEFKIELLKT